MRPQAAVRAIQPQDHRSTTLEKERVPDLELHGKVAIVTGATRKRGLGRAIALCLARAGADVVVTGSGLKPVQDMPVDERESNWRGATDVAGEVEALGVRALAMAVDVTSSAAVRQMVTETAAKLGRIDILVNNATFARGDDRVPLQELDDDVWRRIVDVNLNGTMLCCKYAAQQMIQQGAGGTIVSISSAAALKAQANFSAYCASKAAIHALNAVLAAELGSHGITANVIAPGILDTARVDMLREGGRWEKRLSSVPLGRAGTPEEVAELVRYLCGAHARWISGDVFLMTGGEVRRAAD
ncbi:MAG: SDR family oxidoreductase [Betaproteobacteria bacterium]|nr:SDR family oxidoreductase [Betaproteobacteria bacterium]